MIKITPSTMPTTAREDGKDSMPFETISAIIRTATSCHDIVLYLICVEISNFDVMILPIAYLMPLLMSERVDIVARRPVATPRRLVSTLNMIFAHDDQMILNRRQAGWETNHPIRDIVHAFMLKSLSTISAYQQPGSSKPDV